MKYYADIYNFHTRIYAMKSRLLTHADYVSLVGAQPSSQNTIESDADVIEAKEEIFRKEIEKVLLLAEATRVYEPLFLAFLRRYEAHNIKCVMAKLSGRSSLAMWYDIGHFAILDRNLLQDDISFDDMKMMLAGTYLDGLFEKKLSYEHLEIRIDLLAVKNMVAASASLNAEAGDVVRKFIVKGIAVFLALQRIRLRTTYHAREERVASNERVLSDLFEEPLEPHVRVVETALARCGDSSERSGRSTPAIPDMEYCVEHYFYQWILSMFHRNFHAPYCVIAYLWLLAYQIRNLYRIIEGRRFRLPHEAILERIISAV